MSFAKEILFSSNIRLLHIRIHYSAILARRRIVVFFLFFLLLGFNSAPSPCQAHDSSSHDIATLEETSAAIRSVIKSIKTAVVHIFIEKRISDPKEFFQTEQLELLADPFFNDFFGSNSDLKKERIVRSHGSGFLIDQKGYILTNSHVIQNAEKIMVQLVDNRKFDAEITGMDLSSDIALIKIKGSNLPSIALGDSDKIEIGDWAIAVGYPYLRRQTVTMGIICATGLNDIGINEYENYIQTDAVINPGNSGGPLVNIYGQAIGMNTTFSSPVNGGIGAGFAIPINMAVTVAKQLKSNGFFSRGWLGANVRNFLSDRNYLTSVKITNIQTNSPAERSGLKKGDLIQSINGILITDEVDFRNRISYSLPRSQITMLIIRDGAELSVNITLDSDTGRPDKGKKLE